MIDMCHLHALCSMLYALCSMLYAPSEILKDRKSGIGSEAARWIRNKFYSGAKVCFERTEAKLDTVGALK